MHGFFAVLLTLIMIAAASAGPPEGVRLSTWVREDIFAAILSDDMESFQKGVAKLDEVLGETPDDPGAVAWRAAAHLYLAGRAHEQGNAAEFDHLYKKAMDGLDRAYALAPRNVSVLAVTAGATSILTARLPEDRRKEAFELSRKSFQELMTLQAAQFDKMPPHHRGEVLTGLAQAEERLGNRAKSREYLTQIVETLAGTPYERAVRGWLDNPGEGKLVCQSCHDAGRLANVMAQR